MRYFIFSLFTLFIVTSCNNKVYVPKPMGYIQLIAPEHDYTNYKNDCPFTFEIAKEAVALPYPGDPKEYYCWFNIKYPHHQATIYCTYAQLKGNLAQYLDDSHELVYKHVIKSNAINESYVSDSLNRVFGTLYELKGDVASPFQFFLTDSTTHFFRASLYFDYKANYDSVAPILNYLQEDMIHIVETFKWQ